MIIESHPEQINLVQLALMERLQILRKDQNDLIDVNHSNRLRRWDFAKILLWTYKSSLIQRRWSRSLLEKFFASKNKIRFGTTQWTTQMSYNMFSRSRSIEMLRCTRSNIRWWTSIRSCRWFTHFILSNNISYRYSFLLTKNHPHTWRWRTILLKIRLGSCSRIGSIWLCLRNGWR